MLSVLSKKFLGLGVCWFDSSFVACGTTKNVLTQRFSWIGITKKIQKYSDLYKKFWSIVYCVPTFVSICCYASKILSHISRPDMFLVRLHELMRLLTMPRGKGITYKPKKNRKWPWRPSHYQGTKSWCLDRV